MPSILIVEDEASLAELLRYNFEASGFIVRSVTTGEDAEVMLREERFDCLVLDWMLPGVTGIELCRRLRQRSETRSLPILMLTARGEEGDREQAVRQPEQESVEEISAPKEEIIPERIDKHDQAQEREGHVSSPRRRQ